MPSFDDQLAEIISRPHVPIYPEAAWLRALSVRQGFKPWRTLPNGVEVAARHWRGDKVRVYRAFLGDLCVGSWSRWEGQKDYPPSGHVGGDYSLVQGHDGPCREFQDWLDEVGRRSIPLPGQTTMEELIA